MLIYDILELRGRTMTLIDEELEIIRIEDLKNIKIPDYQRPYSWGVDSVNTLSIRIKLLKIKLLNTD
jgi:hypothetical protein